MLTPRSKGRGGGVCYRVAGQKAGRLGGTLSQPGMPPAMITILARRKYRVGGDLNQVCYYSIQKHIDNRQQSVMKIRQYAGKQSPNDGQRQHALAVPLHVGQAQGGGAQLHLVPKTAALSPFGYSLPQCCQVCN